MSHVLRALRVGVLVVDVPSLYQGTKRQVQTAMVARMPRQRTLPKSLQMHPILKVLEMR